MWRGRNQWKFELAVSHIAYTRSNAKQDETSNMKELTALLVSFPLVQTLWRR